MRVGIAGAGFAGLAAAIAFERQGHDVTVFEAAEGPSSAGGAISLARNALACLQILGVRTHIATQSWSHTPATVRASDGQVVVRSTLAKLTGGGEYATVARSQLIAWLSDALPPDRVHYARRVVKVGADGTIETAGTAERFDMVVGADGARGVVRKLLWSMRLRCGPQASPDGHGRPTTNSRPASVRSGAAPPISASCRWWTAAPTSMAPECVGRTWSRFGRGLRLCRL